MKVLRMPSVNSLTITGRVTADLEPRYLQSGAVVLTIPIAYSSNYKDKAGQWQQETSFFNVVVWGKSAEYCVANLSKGDPVLIEGSLKAEHYTSQDGKKTTAVKIRATRVIPLERERVEQNVQGDDLPNAAESHDHAGEVGAEQESVPF